MRWNAWKSRVEPVLALKVTGKCGSDPSEIGAAMEATFGKLCGVMQASSVTPGGPPRAVYMSYGPEGIGFVVAMPLAQAPAEAIEGEEGSVGDAARRPDPALHPPRTVRRPDGDLWEDHPVHDRQGPDGKRKPTGPTTCRCGRNISTTPRPPPEDQLLTYIYLPVP